MENLSIVTPLSRLEYIIQIIENLKFYNNSFKFNYYLIVDKNVNINSDIFKTIINLKRDIEYRFLNIILSPFENSFVGHSHRNYFLDIFTDNNNWIYFLDDDTKIHENFFKTLYNIDNDVLSKKEFISFKQCFKDKTHRLNSNILKLNNIDTGSVLIKRSIISDNRFELLYDGDGRFIENIYNNNDKDKFLIIDEYCSYYNFFR